MGVSRQTLFQGGSVQVDLFQSRPATDVCGDVERQPTHVVVLPFAGLFSKHDAPGRYVVGTPSHAVFIGADTPYRIGFPGAVGDRALTFRFGEDVAPDAVPRNRAGDATHGLLAPQAILLRNLLRRRLVAGESGTLELEAQVLRVLNLSLEAIGASAPRTPATAHAAQRRAVERVKEAVAADPAEKWTLARLAGVAGLSPFHLCRVFHRQAGTSVHGYVLRERLAGTVDAVLESRANLTGIALDAGFSSHSHFTERFRSFFGVSPTALRRLAGRQPRRRWSKILTAHSR